MSRNLPFASLLAVLAGLALAACGTGQQPAAAHSSVDEVRVYRQFAQCVRDHGQPDFPDPTVDSHGQPHVPDDVPKPPDDVMQACVSILDQLPASVRPQHQDQHPDPAMMRRFAQCMRGHGIDDWPDPDDQGRFRFPPDLANFKSGPRWSQIRAAWDGPCKQYNPTGRIEGAP
jgi:hypothetical protein